ncbi:tetratricopeptide repeat protein [bacterium]|nr:tetratricopeptide repeat protein [bacterium]
MNKESGERSVEDWSSLVGGYLLQTESGDEDALNEALLLTEDFVAAHPDSPQAWMNRGLALWWAGKTGAIDAFLEGERSSGELDGACHHCCLYHLGRIALGDGDVEEAVIYLRKAHEKDPSHLLTLHDLGVAEARRGKSKEGKRLLQMVLEADPDFPGAAKNLQVLLFGEGS